MSGERTKPLTEAERRLWSRLRTNRAFRGVFQRDVSVGHYVVDFAHPGAKLVVEVDDGDITGRRAAEIRAIYLNALGWRVLRVWHSDVDRRPEAIVYAISEAVKVTEPAPARVVQESKPLPAASGFPSAANTAKKTTARKKTVRRKKIPKRKTAKKRKTRRASHK